MIIRSLALGRHKGWAYWTPEELRTARKWMQRFKATGTQRHVFPLSKAAEEVMLELKQYGFERRQSVCKAKLGDLLYG